MYRFIIILALFSSVSSKAPRLILSEYMGDPMHMSDARGEYIELVSLSDTALNGKIFIISGKSDSLTIDSRQLHPGRPYLICKDSLAMSDNNIDCHHNWKKLTIPNSKTSLIILSLKNQSDTIQLLKPIAGKSWENTFESSRSMTRFLPANTIYESGDYGTPGRHSSRSTLPPNYDIAIHSLKWKKKENHGFIDIRLEQLGAKTIDKSILQISIDNDFDGNPDDLLDSLLLETENNLKWIVPESLYGFFHFRIKTKSHSDEDMSNNQKAILINPEPILTITEVCPAPLEDNPEWFEIKNKSPKAVSLKLIYINELPLFAKTSRVPVLNPGQMAVITEDKARFTASYGLLRLELIEPPKWPVLKNGGDTLVLSMGIQNNIYQMRYDAVSSKQRGYCFVKESQRNPNWILVPPQIPISQPHHSIQGTPGFEPEFSQKLEWDIKPEIIDISNPDHHFSISVSAPLSHTFSVWLYDITGYPIIQMCHNQIGKWRTTWKGKDKKGRLLPVGPYIIMVQNNKKRTMKKTLILAKPL